MPEAGGGRGESSDSHSGESNRKADGQVRHHPEEHGRPAEPGGGGAAQPRLLPGQAGPGEGGAGGEGGAAAEEDRQGGGGHPGAGQGHTAHEDLQLRLQIRDHQVRVE